LNTSGLESIGLLKPMHEDRLQEYERKGSKEHVAERKLLKKAHLLVLSQTAAVEPYVRAHLVELRMNYTREDQVMLQHEKYFAEWFKERLITSEIDELRCLARGPITRVVTHQGFDLNGFTWYTKN
jgi:hypothetical protein